MDNETTCGVRIDGNPITLGRIEIPVESYERAKDLADALNGTIKAVPDLKPRLTVYAVMSGVR